MAKNPLPDHVSTHLSKRGVDVSSLDDEAHNTLAELSDQEVQTLDSAATTLNKLAISRDEKLQIV